ncbi:hypothetical protein SAMN05421823_110156 [Catalinimonas alkaloidigena]|uniref:DUF1680 family protein n=2 Tax=Catalinimonas alkaloidigena TaxID=1075417 RepID=A0A1G9QG45_9BACT|nr:hypothetical protein SAMN05421823_110156 [Catalinimonas alkaloidigena]
MAQDKSLVNTTASPHAQLHSVNMGDVAWTEGFWADRFQVCRDTMIPHLWEIYSDPNVAHAFRNFEIAAGLAQGEHEGPPFHDGDFYKLFEAMANTYALTKDEKLDALMDRIIPVIAASQRADGYIHTPVIIEQKKQEAGQTEFQDRLNFETYNLGHLMTAACVHYRATGKTALLDVARKATDYLYDFYQRASDELARNAICPSHYMGVVEMYRTTHDAKYLELAQRLIDIRGMVGEGVGTDHNQDRVPFRQQTKAMGHAVRANYLYAGVADVYAETGEDSLMHALDAIWDDLMQHKMYITGACGALYDGVSPQGTSYQPSEIQQVHQAYGREYQLPNLTAHNETCANIGNVLWNWRMLQVTGEARFADVLELSLYNSVLSGVSLDGQRFFYTNPLRVSQDLPYELRWAGQRQEYIALSNCCPPNAVRTVAEVSNYLYSVSDQGVWVNLYGGNRLDTKLADGTRLKLTQTTEYPWDGNIRLTLEQTPKKNLSFFLRIPGWSQGATLQINGEPQQVPLTAGTYAEVNRKWKKGDVIELRLPMEAKLVEANPLVEETRNQVAVKRGPIVYCLESTDLPQGEKMANVALPVGMKFQPKRMQIDGSAVMSLEGQAELLEEPTWQNQLYREVTPRQPKPASVRLIPYYAWGNRGQSDMSVWLPLSR